MEVALISDHAWPPPLDRSNAVCAPYVDNVNILGVGIESVSRLIPGRACDHQPPENRMYMYMLELILDGRERCFTVKPRRAWCLWYALESLGRLGSTTQGQMQKVAVHLVHRVYVAPLQAVCAARLLPNHGWR